MADQNEIYDAIRKADAAGDGESVKNLAAYLDQGGASGSVANPFGGSGAALAPDKQGAFNTELQSRFDAGAKAEDLQKFAKDSGITLNGLDQAISYRDKGGKGATVYSKNGAAAIQPGTSDVSAGSGILLGAEKVMDRIKSVTGQNALDQGLESLMGLSGTTDQTIARHQADLGNNTRTGYQTLGQIAGTLPLAAIPGANTTAGLTIGGAAGSALMSDSPDATGMAKDAALGAVGGLVGGKIVAPLVGRAGQAVGGLAKKGYQSLSALATGAVPEAAQAATPEAGAIAAKTAKILLKTLADQGHTPSEAMAIIKDAQARGVPLALMDTGDEARGLASALSRKPGESRTVIRDAVVPRQDAQIDRVTDAVKRDLGPTANVREQSEALMQKANEDATPHYDRFRAEPAKTSEELESLLQTPAGKSAIARARVIAANDRKDPAKMGFAIDANGDTVLNPAPTGQAAARDAARADLTAATDAYKTAKATTGTATAKPLARMEAARDALRKAEADLASAPEQGAAADIKAYSPETLDYVKRGLDDVVEQHRDKTTGRLVLDTAARAENNVRGQFVKEMDNLYPDTYSAARAAYAGPAAMKTALAKGSSIATKDAETLAAETRDLSGPELDQYKLGVRSALVKQMEARVDAADKVKALVGSPKKRAALAQIFGGEDQFGRFLSTLEDEGRAAATHARVNTGSATAANLGDDTNLEGIAGVAANAGIRAIKGHGLVGNAVATLGDLYRYGAGEAGARTRADLARAISNTDPQALEALLQSTETRRLSDVARGNATKALSPYAAQAVGAGAIAAKK